MFWSALAIIFVFGAIVMVHEWGHMTAAKLCGVSVPDFAIGMGPSLWSFRWRGTKYHICAFPIGGFVKIAGLEGDDALAGTKLELEEIAKQEKEQEQQATNPLNRNLYGARTEIDPKTWHDINGWQKAAILVGGPLMNFVLAVVIIFAMSAAGFPQQAVLIQQVAPGSPAEQAGLKDGDLITQADGQRVTKGTQFAAIVHAHKNQEMQLTVKRGGETLQLAATPQVMEGYNRGKVSIGIVMGDQEYLTNEINLVQPKSVADGRLVTTTGEQFRLSVGDRITAVNGQPLTNALDLLTRLAEIDDKGSVVKPADSDFTLTVMHADGATHDFLVPADTSIISLGLSFKPELQRLPFVESMGRSLEDCKIYMISMVWGLRMLFTKEGAKAISGPVGIVRIIGQSARSDFHTFLFVFMLINLNLGLMNLLPIPALDGGRLVFVALNGIGVKINAKREALVHAMGIVLLFTFIGLVTLTDVWAWWK